MALTYRQAGVDVRRADRWLERLKPVIRATHGPGVLPDLGQFASLFQLSAYRFRDPVLVSSTDGAGTKLKVAQLVSRHVSIGIDVVAMNVNDVLVYGAQPLFFLDYLAVGKISPRLMSQLVRGVTIGCRQSGCALIGGETAEMPGVYEADEYDIAGFCVGAVDRKQMIDGSSVQAGDVVLGLASSGVHANGFSLVRRVFGSAKLKRLASLLLVPTRIYVKPVLAAVASYPIKAITHVTGGGLARRLPSLVAKHPSLMVKWEPGAWPMPPIFRVIQEAGGLDEQEMYATFNMGIGMALVCPPQSANRLGRFFQQQRLPTWIIGTIRHR